VDQRVGSVHRRALRLTPKMATTSTKHAHEGSDDDSVQRLEQQGPCGPQRFFRRLQAGKPFTAARLVRPVAAVVLPVTIGAALSGCVDRSDGSIKVEGDSILFAVCESVRTDLLRANVIDGGDWAEIWRASGEAMFSPGEIVTLGVDPRGMASTYVAIDPVFDGRTVNLSLADPDGGVGWVIAAPWDELRTDLWRNQDGQYAEAPCSDE
jgi:hypothetical protein